MIDFDADPDPAFDLHADTDPDLAFPSDEDLDPFSQHDPVLSNPQRWFAATATHGPYIGSYLDHAATHGSRRYKLCVLRTLLG